MTNGAKFFRDEYGTGWEFFSIDQAASINYLPGLPANLIPIAFDVLGTNVCHTFLPMLIIKN
ncbi:hypothetical protein [Paenibacillus chitinolyticus]|uniref:hypothetical protein n=1 Tax=Paenibacillus chitinolyticus TaxID=79263 RepID=UPI003523062A